MKTNNRLTKEEKQELKNRHRLECVMQESGERFEADAKKPHLWNSATMPGLVVDTKRQTFTHPITSGDVFTWLLWRNNWTFPQAIRYLQNRPPDPQRVEAAQPARREDRPAYVAREGYFESESPDLEIESSGLYERGVGSRDGKTFYIYELKPVDRWQEKALEIAGDRIRKFFTWQWYSLAMMDETRIEPVFVPGVTECARCEKRIDWNVEKIEIRKTDGWGNTYFQHEHIGAIPVIAYSVKHPLRPWDFGIENEETSEALSGLWLEEEVICGNCAWREYDLLQALELVKKSAYRRMERETEEKQARDRARWLEEERERERQEREAEAAFECDLAAPLP